MNELTHQALEIYQTNNHISPGLLMRKLKISHKKAYSICCEIWQFEAIKRFKARCNNTI